MGCGRSHVVEAWAFGVCCRVSAPSCAGQDPVFRKRMSPRQYYIMCIGPNLYVDEVEGVVPNPLLTVTTLFDVYPTMTCGQGK